MAGTVKPHSDQDKGHKKHLALEKAEADKAAAKAPVKKDEGKKETK